MLQNWYCGSVSLSFPSPLILSLPPSLPPSALQIGVHVLLYPYRQCVHIKRYRNKFIHKFVCTVCNEREGAVEGYVKLALYYCSKPLGTIGLSVLEGGREGGRERDRERERMYMCLFL